MSSQGSELPNKNISLSASEWSKLLESVKKVYGTNSITDLMKEFEETLNNAQNKRNFLRSYTFEEIINQLTRKSSALECNLLKKDLLGSYDLEQHETSKENTSLNTLPFNLKGKGLADLLPPRQNLTKPRKVTLSEKNSQRKGSSWTIRF